MLVLFHFVTSGFLEKRSELPIKFTSLIPFDINLYKCSYIIRKCRRKLFSQVIDEHPEQCIAEPCFCIRFKYCFLACHIECYEVFGKIPRVGIV